MLMPAALVIFPPALYPKTGYQSRLNVEGETINDIIEELEQRFPGIRFNLCSETGELRQFVNIFIEKENIRYLRGLETTVPAGACICILPSVAGG
jgi:molybdopterin synthase sulfur carrier subunit